jgi:CheY-like chemotaxis protein
MMPGMDGFEVLQLAAEDLLAAGIGVAGHEHHRGQAPARSRRRVQIDHEPSPYGTSRVATSAMPGMV